MTELTKGIGLIGFGGYVPRFRLRQQEIAAAHGWVNPGLSALARGARSTAGWDEDAVTMAVEAARDAMTGADRASLGALTFATTTAPFLDRLNAAIVAAALGLDESTTAQDVTGSLRAGTTALRAAIDAAVARGTKALCVAADRRAAPAATAQELATGHGAAALLVGHGPVVARLIGAVSMTVDFVDHYRADGQRFDYQWEERWVRDEGYLKLVPKIVGRLLEETGTAPDDIDHFCMPCPIPRLDRAITKAAGLPDGSLVDDLTARCGDTGAAHPLALLVRTLETASAGQRVMVVGFGSGCDALLFEVTEAIDAYRACGTGISKWLENQVDYTYPRYATLNGLLRVDRGIRSEADKATAMTALYRHRDFVLGLVGGRCTACGTHQLPRTRLCVNPDCAALDSQEPHSFADSVGRVASWSADTLTYTPDPPAYYGMIDFNEGGRLMMDFTNVGPAGVEVRDEMRMVFRVKDLDPVRGFTRYFWKAAPTGRTEAN